MRNWLKRLVSKGYWTPDYSRLTYQGWVAHPENVADAQAVFSMPQFLRMLSLLQNCRPQGYPLRGEKLSTEQGLVELGRIAGYNDCMALLISLGNLPAKVQEPLEADFAPPEPTNEEDANTN